MMAPRDRKAITSSHCAAGLPPIFPAGGTQQARLLATLIMYGPIGSMDGWIQLGIYRLSNAVLQLRRLGWAIETHEHDVCNRFDEQCRVALYVLPDDDIRRAGPAAQAFALQEMSVMSQQRMAV